VHLYQVARGLKNIFRSNIAICLLCWRNADPYNRYIKTERTLLCERNAKHRRANRRLCENVSSNSFAVDI